MGVADTEPAQTIGTATGMVRARSSSAIVARAGPHGSSICGGLCAGSETLSGTMRYRRMPTYHHRVCDRSGQILQDEKIQVPGRREAIAYANSGLSGVMRTLFPLHPGGRVEIADSDGHPIARIYFAEAAG